MCKIYERCLRDNFLFDLLEDKQKAVMDVVNINAVTKIFSPDLF